MCLAWPADLVIGEFGWLLRGTQRGSGRALQATAEQGRKRRMAQPNGLRESVHKNEDGDIGTLGLGEAFR